MRCKRRGAAGRAAMCKAREAEWRAVAVALGFKTPARALRQIGERLGYDPQTVRARMIRYGILRRPRGGPNHYKRGPDGNPPGEP